VPPAKFRPGDPARIGGKHRPWLLYPWLRRGRVVKVKAVVGSTNGGHLLYLIAGRRGVGDYPMPGYDMRLPEERQRAAGGGRTAAKE
jgi:hypothetical protein